MSTRWKPYPRYKDSGVEWLGRVPEHWEVRRFKFLASVRNGQVDPEDQSFEEMVLIAPNHIESGTGRLLFTESAKEQGAISGKYFVEAGEVIYSKIRPALNKAVIARAACLCSADMYPIRASCDLEPSYLLLSILADRFVKHMVDESMRVAMPKVNREDLYNCWFAVPPAVEQRSIASFLDRETTKIDALVGKKERLIELLQEKRMALISHAVTQGLNPDAPMKDSGIPWLGRIPAHWEAGRLKVRLRMVEQGWSPQCENRPAEEGEWGVLKVGCMNGSVYRESENKALPTDITPAKGLEIRVGDVLMSRSNTVELVGSVGIVHNTQGKILLCDKLFRLVFAQRGFLPDYAVHLLRSPVARRQIEAASSGASPSMKNISNGAVGGLLLPFPPYEEQPTIVAWISRNATKLDALISKVRTAIERLQEYRTALISAAVTGQIDVRQVFARLDSPRAGTTRR